MSRTVSRWSQLVEVDGRWTVVTIDTHANQVTVPNLEGGRRFHGGTGDAAIEACARYTIAHRPQRAYPSREAAERALAADGWRVWQDSDGDLRVDDVAADYPEAES